MWHLLVFGDGLRHKTLGGGYWVCSVSSARLGIAYTLMAVSSAITAATHDWYSEGMKALNDAATIPMMAAMNFA